MLSDITLWPEKLSMGLQFAHDFYQLNEHRFPSSIKKIAFLGMGGSGIAGRIIKTFFDKHPQPLAFCIAWPQVPPYIDEETLAIVVSYSGNTWETVAALKELIQRGIPSIVIAHGGKAQEIAYEHNLMFMKAPDALMPRSALAHMMGFLLGLFDHLRVLPGKDMVSDMIQHASLHCPILQDESYFDDFLEVAHSREFFHIWGVSQDSISCAFRAQTQFNENSKVHAVASEFPEVCHNLIVGFSRVTPPPLVLVFRSKYLPDKLSRALQATWNVLDERGIILYKPPVLGDNFHNQLLHMIMWSDFASYYLGKIRGVDTVSVEIIDTLKAKFKDQGITV